MPMTDIWIMRIGHRPHRDKRVTTHVALSSRALGAKGIYVDTEDRALEENIKSVCERFGGDFEIHTGVKWKDIVKGFDGIVVHLTMYGQRLDGAMDKIPAGKDILAIVGAEKVPPEVYERADLNISVGNQPHSEIAALSIFLDRLTKGDALYRDRNGSFTVIPNERGKTIVEVSK
jgi:tRNA (cytidine56-2'-O)-methyltransferase